MSTPGRIASAHVQPVSRRHGKSGYVRVTCDVTPELREQLVELAWRQRTSLTDVIRQACEAHVEANR